MPANLPPQYFDTEKKLQTARTPREKIKILEELLAIVPKHKGTEKLQALLKTKIAKLRFQSQLRPTVARHEPGFHVEKSGAGQVVLVGPANAGKSLLIASLTGAQPEVGDYPYTTRSPSPYMMKYENIKIQLVDTPPIAPDDLETGFVELIKTADGVLFVLDLADPDPSSKLEALLLRLKEKRLEFFPQNAVLPPDSASVVKKTLIAANKCDFPQAQENFALLQELFSDRFNFVSVSALRGDGLEELKRKIFSLLDIIRVYSKAPGKKADLNDPFALKKGSTVNDAARAVHKDFVEKLKYARIWRKALLQGQMVNRDFLLEDGDIVELHI
jgi:hypothetical protein